MRYNKLILTISLICTICFASASEFDYGYSDADGSRVMNFKNVMPLMFHGYEITPVQEYKDSNAGYMAYFGVEAKKDLPAGWDVFFNVDYLTDEVLAIQDQVDYKIGFGCEVFNNYDDKHKLSYALIYRAGDYLNSYRYKYKHTANIFNVKAIITLVSPTNAVQGELEAFFNIFKSLAFTVNHSYKIADGKRSYISLAGFKLSY